MNLENAKSTSDIWKGVPESWLNVLIQDGQDVNYKIWRWGDMANKIIAKGAKKMLAYKAVAEVVGKRSSSIRNYSYIARTFPPEVREEYGVLSIEHFKTALQHENQGGNHLDVLTYAVGVMHERNGRPASVDECRVEFGVGGGDDDLEVPGEEDEDRPIYEYPAFAMPMTRRIKMVRSPQVRRKLTKAMRSLIWRIENEK